MTLGMIWTIILRFAIQDISVEGNSIATMLNRKLFKECFYMNYAQVRWVFKKWITFSQWIILQVPCLVTKSISGGNSVITFTLLESLELAFKTHKFWACVSVVETETCLFFSALVAQNCAVPYVVILFKTYLFLVPSTYHILCKYSLYIFLFPSLLFSPHSFSFLFLTLTR